MDLLASTVVPVNATLTLVSNSLTDSVVWAGINNNRKTNLVIINGNLNAQRYRDELLGPVVIPYVNANPNAIFHTQRD